LILKRPPNNKKAGEKKLRAEVIEMKEKQVRWTKKDFQFVADILANALKLAKGSSEREGVKIAAVLFAFALKETNPSYNLARFLDAVGLSFNEAVEIYERRNLAEALN
jgi:hypothetical protein